ncbi:MAG: hypothetical protein AB1726_10605 [Planctomycetota bacterium]
MHRKFKELLHQYKLDIFHLEHRQKDVASITKECMHLSEEVLSQKFNFHYHKLPDANRAEIINMINNYTREALLPPVVEKIIEHHVMLERRVLALEDLLAKMLEALSVPQAASHPPSG